MRWAALRRRDGKEVFVDGAQVLGIWNDGPGCRLWSYTCGYLDLAGTAGANAEELDLELSPVDVLTTKTARQ
jgi:hypothetical protein